MNQNLKTPHKENRKSERARVNARLTIAQLPVHDVPSALALSQIFSVFLSPYRVESALFSVFLHHQHERAEGEGVISYRANNCVTQVALS